MGEQKMILKIWCFEIKWTIYNVHTKSVEIFNNRFGLQLQDAVQIFWQTLPK